MPSGDVLLSTGSNKFQLLTAAVELAHRGRLERTITAGYPTPRVRFWVASLRLHRRPAVSRLLDRQEPDLDDVLVAPLWLPEAILQSAGLIQRLCGSLSCSETVTVWGMRTYGRLAARIVRRSAARLYHYRAGYGSTSVPAARRKGIVTLCEHSIAHPAVADYLVAQGGRLPPPGTQGPMGPLGRHLLADIAQADHVLANSDFVKDTFLHQGWNPCRVHVIYRGTDEKFLSALPARDFAPRPPDQPLRLLFAGGSSRRKGFTLLVQALQQLQDLPWELEIVSALDRRTAARHAAFLNGPRVVVRGVVQRHVLALRLSQADILVHPSLAEGSARVGFEGLAAGCVVITTPSSGTVVRDGENGFLTPPGDAGALAQAVRRALELDRAALAAIGRKNAELVRRSYRQSDYGNALVKLYDELLEEQARRARAGPKRRGGAPG